MRLQRKRGFYEKYIKRIFDIICSFLAIVFFCWLYVIIAIIVRVKLGSPVIFKQHRPGLVDPKTGQERIFYMYKFRTMTDEKDEYGDYLSDYVRMTGFGRVLRSTSLDELPEAWNILKGDMSVIGPRPQLVRDMVFMNDIQRMRHTAKPGLSGLAQVMGRNAISWEEKLDWDLKYIENVNIVSDMKILFLTVFKIFGAKGAEGSAETDVTDDYGDALLKEGKITKSEYDALQAHAENLITRANI